MNSLIVYIKGLQLTLDIMFLCGLLILWVREDFNSHDTLALQMQSLIIGNYTMFILSLSAQQVKNFWQIRSFSNTCIVPELFR